MRRRRRPESDEMMAVEILDRARLADVFLRYSAEA